MPKITAQELREKYLKFFESKGHTIIPSASLLPSEDSSALFVNSGMFPLAPYLLGEKHPLGRRLANVQKCIRTVDIDSVGDDTHVTFLEMLGNWSLGDYFKAEAIKWSFEFLTSSDCLNLPRERLAVSVFAGDRDAPRDQESADIWKSLGVSENRIAFLPKEDNWWIAGSSGPCGPDTEMFYWIDDGASPLLPFQDHHKDSRWVEIWNDVFMQFEKLPDGKLVLLKQQSVDTGMGLDRTLAVLNGQKSVYDTELFDPMFRVLELDQEVMTNDEARKARIVVDHVRAAVFIAGEGVEPSNKDRGYILRRLLRRSLVMGRLLNLKHRWLAALIGKVVSIYARTYGDLVEKSENIFKVILDEQKKFGKTLEKGLKEFERLMKIFQGVGAGFSRPSSDSGRASAAPTTNIFNGKDAFDLYQTYGFPWELTQELAESAGKKIDKAEFEAEFKKHQQLSRTASAGQFKGGLAGHSDKIIRLHTATHLLNAALRDVLGDNVWQKGSNITEERTRFDFTHDKKMSPEEIAAVEAIVSDWIARDLQVKKEIMPLKEARELGAIGVFGEKYSDAVSIYTIFDPSGEIISREFCGGPHVERTGVIGKFKIQKEEASSAGVRRIKAAVE